MLTLETTEYLTFWKQEVENGGGAAAVKEIPKYVL
jgi:hypothetical protein